jgi:hypothetical protein
MKAAIGTALVWIVAKAIYLWHAIKIRLGLAEKPRPTE